MQKIRLSVYSSVKKVEGMQANGLLLMVCFLGLSSVSILKVTDGLLKKRGGGVFYP